MTTPTCDNVIRLPVFTRLTEEQVQLVSYALQDASMLIERLARKRRISQRDADVLDKLARAAEVFGMVLPGSE